MLIRNNKNPIISPDPKNSLTSKKVYNPTVVKRGDKYEMLFRAVGDDWISRIMRAESADGENFTMFDQPAFEPQNSWEAMGCEDPRAIFLNGKYWVTYTAFDGKVARAALASSNDLISWNKHNLIFPKLLHPQRENHPGDWSKAAAIFAEKIDNQYYLLFGDNHIWSATSPDLINWKSSSVPIIAAREGYFDSAYVEMGPPPLKTKHGWLILYHGIDAFSSTRKYRLGAALSSLDNPLEITWRCTKPILEPDADYETFGLIDLLPGGFMGIKNLSATDVDKIAAEHNMPMAIFCCGAVIEGDIVRLYYGAADTRICTAVIDLKSIYNS